MTMTRITLPLRQGGGGSVAMLLASHFAEPWMERLGKKAPGTGPVRITLDVFQGVAEIQATGVVFMSQTTGPPRFGGVPSLLPISNTDAAIGLTRQAVAGDFDF